MKRTMQSFMASEGRLPFRLLRTAIGFGILTIIAGCGADIGQSRAGDPVTNLTPSPPVATPSQVTSKKPDDKTEVVNSCPTGVGIDIQKPIGLEHWLIVSCPSPGVWAVRRTLGDGTRINTFAYDGLYISIPFVNKASVGAEIDSWLTGSEKQPITVDAQWEPMCKCTSYSHPITLSKYNEKQSEFISDSGASYPVQSFRAHQDHGNGNIVDYEYNLAGPVTFYDSDGKHVFFVPTFAQHISGLEDQFTFKTVGFLLPK